MKFHKKRLVFGIVFILLAIAFVGYVSSTIRIVEGVSVFSQIFAQIGTLIATITSLVLFGIGIICIKASLTWR